MIIILEFSNTRRIDQLINLVETELMIYLKDISLQAMAT